MKDLHHVRIECPDGEGILGRVFLDGEQVKGCTGVVFRLTTREVPTVVLTLYADVEIEGEAEVVQRWRNALTEALA